MSEQTETIARPSERDHKAEWIKWAVATHGMTETEAADLTKDALMALPAANGSGEEAPTGETTSRKRKPTPDTSGVKIEDIEAAALIRPDEDTEAAFLMEAGQPQRARKPEQLAMDAIAQKLYQRWVDAGRPSQWAKMPVITYYRNEDEVAAWKYLIRRACAVAEAVEPDTGVRVHFGNDFTLSERMAAKIGRPDDAGKTVIMWAAIAKRPVTEEDGRRAVVEAHQEDKENGDVPERPENDEN